MKIVINVEGMGCPKCEKKVENACLAIDGVKKAKASFKDNNVVVDCEESAKDLCVKAINEVGYKA